MKLIFCKKCQDIIRLFEETRKCRCGKSGGRYIDEKNAEYWGINAVPIGINNKDFALAIKHVDKINGDRGHIFDAFVIKKDCKTFTPKVKGKAKV